MSEEEFYNYLMAFYAISDEEEKLRKQIRVLQEQAEPMIEQIQIELERGHGHVVDRVLKERYDAPLG